MERRSHDGPIVDGRPCFSSARQNDGHVTFQNSHQTLSCYGCLPFPPVYSFVWYRRTECFRETDGATEHTPESVN
eukprot:2173119-Pleurochrysis_carterae.AAC.3